MGSGFDVGTFECGRSFLLEPRPELPGCVLLDLALPSLGGLQVQNVGLQALKHSFGRRT